MPRSRAISELHSSSSRAGRSAHRARPAAAPRAASGARPSIVGSHGIPPRWYSGGSEPLRGEMREWLNRRDWKSREPVTPAPRVRIPLSPPALHPPDPTLARTSASQARRRPACDEIAPPVKRPFDPWLVGSVLVVPRRSAGSPQAPLTGDDDYVAPQSRGAEPARRPDRIHRRLGEGRRRRDGLARGVRHAATTVRSPSCRSVWWRSSPRLFREQPDRLQDGLAARAPPAPRPSGRPAAPPALADPVTAAAIVALLGLHPAAAECVGWLSCRVDLTCRPFASLLRRRGVLRLARRGHGPDARRVLAAGTGALFSYEAAVGVLAAAGRPRLPLAEGRRSAAPERPTGRAAPCSPRIAAGLYLSWRRPPRRCRPSLNGRWRS